MMEVHHGTPEDIEVIIGGNGNVDINVLQEEECGGQNGLSEETASCSKSDKTMMPTTQDHNLTYPVLVQSSVMSSEPMNETSGNLPVIAMAPGPDNTEKALEGDGINQAWFTTKEDKDCLQGKGVKWRQGMWAKDEVELLKSNILNYCKARGIPDPHDVIFKQSKDERKSFYRTIAKGIHRPLFAIYRRVLRTYESGNYIGKYTSQEVRLLKELRKKHGNDWTAIGLALGRSASSVKDRCRLLKEKCTSGKWSDEEEQCLSSAVHQLTSTKPGESVTTGILWTNVAKMMGTRSEKQCRSKWLNYLNWKECGGKEWNKTDEIDLIKKIYDLGLENENEIDWVTMANGWVSVRSPQWLRSKWWTIKKHVPASQNMTFTEIISYLHSNYARNLRNRLDRQDPRYLQLPTPEQDYPLQGYCGSLTTNVGQAISVDGQIFVTREDNKGTDGLNAFEMVQLRVLPNIDPSQPTSYIIEPIHCSISGTVPSYILQQASPHPGTKLVKITGNSNLSQQVIGNNDVGNIQHETIQGNGILSAPQVVVTSLTQVCQGDVAPIVVSTETLQEDGGGHVGQSSSKDNPSESYVGEKHVNTIEEHQQPLQCITEQQMTMISDRGKENCEDFGSGEMTSHQNVENKTSHGSPVSNQCTSMTSVCSQSLDINFPTSDNSIYSHPLIPGLVSSGQTSSSQIANNEVVTPQPTLPDNILQSQCDEPSFLSDSGVPSPLSMVAGSLGEVTVPNSSHDLSSNDLIMDDEFHISDVSG